MGLDKNRGKYVLAAKSLMSANINKMVGIIDKAGRSSTLSVKLIAITENGVLMGPCEGELMTAPHQNSRLAT